MGGCDVAVQQVADFRSSACLDRLDVERLLELVGGSSFDVAVILGRLNAEISDVL